MTLNATSQLGCIRFICSKSSHRYPTADFLFILESFFQRQINRCKLWCKKCYLFQTYSSFCTWTICIQRTDKLLSQYVNLCNWRLTQLPVPTTKISLFILVFIQIPCYIRQAEAWDLTLCLHVSCVSLRALFITQPSGQREAVCALAMSWTHT